MKFILRGQNFDSNVNFSPNPTNLILVDNASGGLEAILSSDYNISGYQNLGGTYNPLGTIQTQLLDIYLCSDPDHIVYGEGGNTFKLASEVNLSSLEPLKTAYSEGEEFSVCYITDFVKITPGTNMVQANPAEFQDYLYCVNNTFDFKALADKGWDITYYDQNLCEPSPLNGQANVDTKVTVAPKSQTQPCNYTMDLDSTEGICTPGPEFCWTDWTTATNQTIVVPEKRSVVSLSITGTKPTGSFRYEFRNVPSWATIDSSSLAFMGTKVISGNFTVNCEDTTQVRSADFQLIILGPDQKPYSITNYKLNQVITDVKITCETALNLKNTSNDNISHAVIVTGTVATDNYSVNYRADQSWINIDSSAILNLSSGNTVNYRGYLKISTPANPDTSPRTGNITIEFLEGGEVKTSKTVLVTQAGSTGGTLTLVPGSVNVGSSGDSGLLNIVYTGSGNLTVSGESWITAEISDKNVLYRVTTNNSERPRVGYITVTDGTLEAVCRVSQDGSGKPTATVTVISPVTGTSWNVGKGETSDTLTWKAEGNSYGLKTSIISSTESSWIKLSPVTGENSTTDDPYSLTETRTVRIEANPGEARTGKITLEVSWSNGLKYYKTINVYQGQGGSATLTITPDSISTNKNASTQTVNFSYSETGSLNTTKPGDSWVIGPTEVSGSGDYNFVVLANGTGKTRTTTFEYATPSGLSKNLTFIQTGDDSSVTSVNWIQPDNSPEILPEGTYSDKFLWTATGNYTGSVLPRFEYEYLINGNPGSAIVMYPGEVNEQVYTNGSINIRQKGDFSVNRNALKEGVNTVQVNPKIFLGDRLLAQRTQTWMITKPKSSPSGSGSGSYDPGNPGDTDIPENYITVVNQATPFYIAEENTDFTFTAQYAGPYSGNYNISATGVTEISRVDNSGNGVVNVQVTYRVTSSSQVTLRLSDSTTTLGYLTIPVYKVAATVHSVSDDVILSGNSGDLMTITQNSSNRLIWNDPVYAAPGYTTVNVNATQMLKELVEAPRLNLNASSPRSIDTFSVRIGSSLSNLALVDSWNGFTTGFASTYLNSEIAFNSYIPATVINGGSIEIRTPLGDTISYSGNSKQYLDVTYKVSLCGIYRVNGKSLKVVDSDYQLFFYNASGGWSSLVPRAVANPGYQFSRSSYQLSPTQTRVYQVDTVKTWKLRTAWISEDLSDLFGSARVYLHDIKAGKLYEVTITDTKYDFKTFRNNRRKLVSVEINVQSVDTSIRR